MVSSRLGSIVLAATSVAAALIALTPRWQSNDDPILEMLVAGRGIALAPDFHLVFSSVVSGVALQRLYLAWPAVPWYGLHQVALLTLALAALAHRLLDAGRRRGVALYAVLFGTVGLYSLMNLQFSMTAFLGCAAGLALALTGAPGALRPHLGRVVAGSLLFALASLLRREFGGLALAAVASPVAVVALGSARWRGVAGLARRLALVLSPAALLWGADAVHDARCEEWREFRSLTAPRLHIVDRWARLDTRAAGPVLKEIGWSANDLAMVQRWFYPDPELHSLEKLETLRRRLPVHTHALGLDPELGDALLAAARGALLPVLLAIPCFWLHAAARGRWSSAALACATLVGAAGLFAAIALGYSPLRLVAAFCCFPLVAAIALGPAQPRPGRAGPAVLLLGFAAVLVSVSNEVSESALARERNRRLRQSLVELDPSPRELYIAWANTFPYESALPLENTGYLSDLHLYSLGWPQRSPVGSRMLQAHGVSDVFTALYARDDVHFIASPRGLAGLSHFGREHRGVRVSFGLVRELPAFRLFRGRLLGPMRKGAPP